MPGPPENCFGMVYIFQCPDKLLVTEGPGRGVKNMVIGATLEDEPLLPWNPVALGDGRDGMDDDPCGETRQGMGINNPRVFAVELDLP